jgi:hypothetical protein
LHIGDLQMNVADAGAGGHGVCGSFGSGVHGGESKSASE